MKREVRIVAIAAASLLVAACAGRSTSNFISKSDTLFPTIGGVSVQVPNINFEAPAAQPATFAGIEAKAQAQSNSLISHEIQSAAQTQSQMQLPMQYGCGGSH